VIAFRASNSAENLAYDEASKTLFVGATRDILKAGGFDTLAWKIKIETLFGVLQAVYKGMQTHFPFPFMLRKFYFRLFSCHSLFHSLSVLSSLPLSPARSPSRLVIAFPL